MVDMVRIVTIRMWALIHAIHHVAPPYFYSNPERTNNTLALEMAFRIFLWLHDHCRFSSVLGKAG